MTDTIRTWDMDGMTHSSEQRDATGERVCGCAQRREGNGGDAACAQCGGFRHRESIWGPAFMYQCESCGAVS